MTPHVLRFVDLFAYDFFICSLIFFGAITELRKILVNILFSHKIISFRKWRTLPSMWQRMCRVYSSCVSHCMIHGSETQQCRGNVIGLAQYHDTWRTKWLTSQTANSLACCFHLFALNSCLHDTCAATVQHCVEWLIHDTSYTCTQRQTCLLTHHHHHHRLTGFYHLRHASGTGNFPVPLFTPDPGNRNLQKESPNSGTSNNQHCCSSQHHGQQRTSVGCDAICASCLSTVLHLPL